MPPTQSRRFQINSNPLPQAWSEKPKLDAVVDGNFPNDIDSSSILSKVMGHKLYKDSSGDLYMRFRINFLDDPVQTQTPKFMDLGFSTIYALDKSSDLITPATRIQKPMDGAHLSVHNHVFGETTAVGVSEWVKVRLRL